MKLPETYYYKLAVSLLEEVYDYDLVKVLSWLETKDLVLKGVPRALIGIGQGEKVIERIKSLTNTCYACKINCGNENCFTNRS